MHFHENYKLTCKTKRNVHWVLYLLSKGNDLKWNQELGFDLNDAKDLLGKSGEANIVPVEVGVQGVVDIGDVVLHTAGDQDFIQCISTVCILGKVHQVQGLKSFT